MKTAITIRFDMDEKKKKTEFGVGKYKNKRRQTRTEG